VAYSPLGRGFLSGGIRSPEALADDDRRRVMPRFQPETLSRNLAILEPLEAMARERRVTAAQLALAWLLAKGEDIVPIPGTKRRVFLEQNVAAAALELSAQDVARLDRAVPRGMAEGNRYADMSLINR
jgi:aryl-alcohol dehydrogenase-like predicted oxidoreductase